MDRLRWKDGIHKLLVFHQTPISCVVTNQCWQRRELPPTNVIIATNTRDPEVAQPCRTKKIQRIISRLPLTFSNQIRAGNVSID